MKRKNDIGFWCQKVLPLVYDDSISYYELLGKVVKYINDLIEQDNSFEEVISKLESKIEELEQEWDEWCATTFNTELEKILASMIFVEINDDGYITYYIPSGWSSIVFNTTELDYKTDECPEYGHLVLSY